jgi:hypothetical protein
MRNFKITFSHYERIAYEMVVEAETEEEAKRIYNDNATSYADESVEWKHEEWFALEEIKEW